MNNEAFKMKGIISPVVTLYNEKGDIDWEANKKLADNLIDKGIHGILFMGSSGEFSALTLEERKQFMEVMTAHVNKRATVLIGIGTTSIKDTIELGQHAANCHADGVLVVNPYYWNYSSEQLITYYQTVADEIKIPVLIYNIPSLTGQSISPEIVEALALSRNNIVGIKDTIENISHVSKMIEITKKRPDFAVFAAFDEHIFPSLLNGAAGAINGTSVFAPEPSVKLYEAMENNNLEEAAVLHKQLISLMNIYQLSEPLFLAMKEAVHQTVLDKQTGSRIPCGPITKDLTEKVSLFLKENKVMN